MSWQLQEADHELFERELESFVPPRIFDAHVHLYEHCQFKGDPPSVCTHGPASVDWETYQSNTSKLLHGRKISALLFGFPERYVDFTSANRFVIRQVKRDGGSRAQMLVHPKMDPEFIRETARREGFIGLKCYHVYASEHPTFNASITSYLPEEQVRVAHEENLTITLHMVRPRAMADPLNQGMIRDYAERYPNVRWILAHAARGFNPHHTVMGIGALKGLRNVWCDTSAVTECGAFEAVMQNLGVDRLLYGSDFPISHARGRCVAFGDSFLWLSAENTSFNSPRGQVQPTLVGIESLRALKLACINLRLSDAQVEAIFFGNAMEFLGC